MIPEIGAMIGGYIIFRCVEALCRNDNAFSSNVGRGVVQVMAVLGIVATLFLVIALINTGSELPALH
jgi:hypothetical protein